MNPDSGADCRRHGDFTHRTPRFPLPGFTLIELLVVVAVIAVLAAILFPVMALVREKSRQTACANNLKQLGNAFHLYLQDWDELFPAFGREKTRTNAGCDYSCHWSPRLKAYIKPALPGQTVDASSAYLCPSSEIATNGYAMNLYLAYAMSVRQSGAGFRWQPGQASDAVGQTDVKSPSSTILLFDAAQPATAGATRGGPAGFFDSWGSRWSHWRQAEPGDLAEDFPTTRIASTRGTLSSRPRHNRGNLICFTDGHVRWVRRIREVAPGNSKPEATYGNEGFDYAR